MRAGELLFERLDLHTPRAHVVECLGRAEEEVEDRADVRRRESEQRGEEDEDRVADATAGVPVHPQGESEPEDDGEEDRDVPGDDESGGVGEVVEGRGGRVEGNSITAGKMPTPSAPKRCGGCRFLGPAYAAQCPRSGRQ